MYYPPAIYTIEIRLDPYPDPESGTLDSDLEVDRQQNQIAWSLHHAPQHLQKFQWNTFITWFAQNVSLCYIF